MKNKLRSALWIGAIAGVAAVGATAGGALASSPTIWAPQGLSAAGSQPAPKPSFPVNDSGSTFGSLGDATSDESSPDLILVVATNGKEGYVRKGDLADADGSTAAAEFKSPEDAIAWQTANQGVDHTIPVFSEDGTTQIGEFRVKGPGASLEPAQPSD